MTYQDAMRAINVVCVQRRKLTVLDKLTETATGYEARIYTRLSDPRLLDRPLSKAGIDVRKIADLGGEWFLFSLVVKG